MDETAPVLGIDVTAPVLGMAEATDVTAPPGGGFADGHGHEMPCRA